MGKRLSSEERLCQKLKESEATVNQSKFEQYSPDFDPNETELGENDMGRNDRTDVSFQSMPNDSGDEEEQPARQPGAALAEPTPLSRQGHPVKRAKAQELFRSQERISSRTCSRSPQGAECASSVSEAPVQTLSPEPTRCCIQVMNAMVKPQLLDLVKQLRNQAAVKSHSFREAQMSSHSSSRKDNGKGRDDNRKKGGKNSRGTRSSRSSSKADKEREEHEDCSRKETIRLEKIRTEQQKQADDAAKLVREAKRKDKEKKEKEKLAKELEARGLKPAPRSKKAAESKVTESASGSSDGKKGAKQSVMPASVSGSSSAGAGGKGATKDAPVAWKSSREIMNYLLQLHATLYPSPKAREQRERIQALHRGFQAQERLRKNSYLQNKELMTKQLGYSRKKRKLHQQRLTEDLSQMLQMDQLRIAAEDDDMFDSEAEEEADRLELSLLNERDSQGERKTAHRQATEKRESRVVASQKEWTNKFMQLAEQLPSSEEATWRDQWRGRD